MNITCPHCGANNVSGAAFCESCGKALPSAAPTGPRVLTGDVMPTSSAGHSMVSDQLRKEMRKASWALLAVAIIQTLLGPVMLFAEVQKEQKAAGVPLEIRPIFWVIVFGIAAAFWALFIWSRFAPLPAAIVGLALFVTLHVIEAISDPMTLAQGWLLKIVVVFVLAKGISAALKYKRMQQATGLAPA